MLIDDPVSLSRDARTELQAARALAALEAEISLGDRSEGWYGQADEALAQLHTRWPRAHLRDAYRDPPSLSSQARRCLGSGRWRRRGRHVLELVAVLAALAAGVALLVRHARRHPRHAIATAVVLAALVTGRPSLIGTAAAIAATVAIVKRVNQRVGALYRGKGANG